MIGVGENDNTRGVSSHPITDRMPFFPGGDKRITEVFYDIYSKVPSEFHDYLSYEGSRLMNFISANLLFSMGGDGLQSAAIALLSDPQLSNHLPAEQIKKFNADVEGLKKEWNLSQACLDYITHKPHIVELIKKMKQPGSIISMKDLQFLEGNVTSIKTYVVDQISQFSTGKAIDLAELDALSQVVAVGSMVAKEKPEYEYQDSDTLAAMGAWIQDIVLLGRYPAVYGEMDLAVHGAIAISPQQRYNLEFLTNVARDMLRGNKSLSKQMLSSGVRIIGRAKSMSSYLRHVLQNQQLIDAINGLIPINEQDPDQLVNLNRILADDRVETNEKRDTLIALLHEAAIFQYDKIGCRIQVQTPEQFNRIARSLSIYTDPQIAVKQIAQLLSNRRSIYYPRLTRFELHDYVRQSIYSFNEEGKPLLDKKNHPPNPLEKFRLSRPIVQFIQHIPENMLGYAALHTTLCTKVSTQRRGKSIKRPVVFEFQLLPWQEDIQASYSALNVLYHANLYRGIRVDPHEVDRLRRASIDGITEWVHSSKERTTPALEKLFQPVFQPE